MLFNTTKQFMYIRVNSEITIGKKMDLVQMLSCSVNQLSLRRETALSTTTQALGPITNPGVGCC